MVPSSSKLIGIVLVAFALSGCVGTGAQKSVSGSASPSASGAAGGDGGMGDMPGMNMGAKGVTQLMVMAADTIPASDPSNPTVFGWNPHTLKVHVGQSVSFTLMGMDNNVLTHDLIVDGLGIAIKDVKAGQMSSQDTVVTAAPGTYKYYCDMVSAGPTGAHRLLGMEGTLTVTG